MTTSSENTEPSPSDLEQLEANSPDTGDLQIARLEDNLQWERDSRKQERLYWAFGVVVVFDAFIASHLSAGATAFIFLMGVIFLIAFAAQCGEEHVVTLLMRLYHKMLS